MDIGLPFAPGDLSLNFDLILGERAILGPDSERALGVGDFGRVLPFTAAAALLQHLLHRLFLEFTGPGPLRLFTARPFLAVHFPLDLNPPAPDLETEISQAAFFGLAFDGSEPARAPVSLLC